MKKTQLPESGWKYRQRGQSIVEFSFAFTGLVVLALFTGSLSVVGYNWLVLQYAASEASRFGSLGTIDPGFTTREDSIRNRVTEIVTSLGLDNVTVVFTDEDGNDTAGSASEFFRVTISRDLSLQPILEVLYRFANLGGPIPDYEIRAGTVIRNEPF